MQLWMLTGFAGLSIGYGILMLSPGNLVRMEESGESFRLFQFSVKASWRSGFIRCCSRPSIST